MVLSDQPGQAEHGATDLTHDFLHAYFLLISFISFQCNGPHPDSQASQGRPEGRSAWPCARAIDMAQYGIAPRPIRVPAVAWHTLASAGTVRRAGTHARQRLVTPPLQTA